jgi:RNA polymerase sigma-70 factor (ECF subfamily)
VPAHAASIPLLRAAPRAWKERSAVRAALRGEAAGVDWLFREHWPSAYRAAWLIVRDEAAAEDIAQEGFLAALRALDRFDHARPFGPWLRTIVARRAIDAQRARALRHEVGDVALAVVAAREDPSLRALSDDVLAAVAGLPDDQRIPIALRHLLGFTPGEIAELLDQPRGTVNSRLRRGLDTLSEELG